VSKCASRDYHDKQTNKNGTNDYPVSHCTCSFNIVFTKKTENEFYHSKMKIQLGKLPLLISGIALRKSVKIRRKIRSVGKQVYLLIWIITTGRPNT
jgi:hypothetical protein